jgi:hypothetical protein
MTTTPPDSNRPENDRPDSMNEPADLSELTATDALLDRLGARAAGGDDLDDPAIAALAELLAEIDESRVPDLGAARLIEVLGSRPLYLAGGASVSDQIRSDVVTVGPRLDEDSADALHDLIGPDSRDSRDRAGQRVIDLTEDPKAGDGATASPVPRPSTGPRHPIIPAARLHEPVPIRPAGASQAAGWHRALRHVSLPAAAVLLLLAICGGVSAAVTGDPMAPVNGITRVMEQLPGVGNSKDKVQGEIKAARQAVDNQDTPAATVHLDNARAGLVDVPDAEKSNLNKEIDDLQDLVLPTATAEPTPAAPGVVATTAPSVPEPTASTEPTKTEAPEPTTQAPSAPEPTEEETTPENTPVAPVVGDEEEPSSAVEPTGS